jgi:gluconolactonase
MGTWLISGKHLLFQPESGAVEAVAEWNSELAAVAISPDHAVLAVIFRHSRFGWAYQPEPDGRLRNGQPFYHFHIPEDADSNRAGAAVFDARGQLYVSTRLGIQIFGHEGRCDAILGLPEGHAVQHLSFGGPEGKTLLAQVADGTVFGRELKVAGSFPGRKPVQLQP